MTRHENSGKSGYAAPLALTAFEKNSRIHSDEQIAMIVSSIERFGFLKPVLCDENKMILAGHGAVTAAINLDLDRIPIRQIFGLTDDQKRAYVIADNRLAELSKWDWDLLTLELTDLHCIDDDLTPIGFPDFGNGDARQTVRGQHNVTIGGDRYLLQLEFGKEREMKKVFDEMKSRGVNVKVLE